MHFTDDLYGFLGELADNNERDWFQANKKRYEAAVKAPALQFIADADGPLRAISPHFRAIPKAVGGSMMRINRDTRFSRDKTPYKTCVGLHFSHEVGRKVPSPGFYLRAGPGETGLAVGLFGGDGKTLTAVREAIVADPDGWQAVVDGIAGTGLDWHGESLKRAPRGFDADHRHVDDLKRKGWIVARDLDPAAVTSDDFMDQVMAIFASAAPLNAFLCRALGLPF